MANPKNLLKGNELGQGWKKGQSGNPSGRGVLEKIIRDALEIPDKETKRAALEDIVHGLIQDATVGVQHFTKNGDSYTQRDNEAVKILFERGYGKSVQPIEGNIGATITLADAIDALLTEKKDK